MIGISTPIRPVVRLAFIRQTGLAPRMTRMVVGGPELNRFEPSPFTDAFVRLVFPPGRSSNPGTHHAGAAGRFRMRTYTVRSFDPVAGELAIDVFDHGRPGLTRSRLAGLRPGDPVLVRDLRGLYRPGPEADWHLLAGDAAALPAIAVTLERMAPGTRAKVLVEVDGDEERQVLPTAADADVRWLVRSRGEGLVDAVRSLTFEPGVVQGFVHGEGGAIRHLRRHLVHERGVARELLSISGYWRRGLNDEQWRERKAAAVGG
ncbi:siderophore-interacting protein [Actinoplanes rectilineatus]|uniref:siderophore-interacting protein n=1 Tax=Actinoplanes rectilineatus TaxID=113571 RepID=UPI0005F28878|nr:siderophore-interacting protein [Actinoplanes rectilineatus]